MAVKQMNGFSFIFFQGKELYPAQAKFNIGYYITDKIFHMQSQNHTLDDWIQNIE